MIDIGHAATFGLFTDWFLCRTLGADEQDAAAVGDHAADIVHCIIEKRQGLLEVYDMDLAALAEDERGHLRVPVTGLVTEMHASLKHLAHSDISH